MDFHMTMRRYGPTVHLVPAGELDLETRAALDEAEAALDGVELVACDMGELSFLDVAGLHGLLGFVHRLDGRSIAFFTYDWQPQPLRLLDLIDSLHPSPGDHGSRGAPTEPLRRSLAESAAAARARGAARAWQDAMRRAAVAPPLR
ncbi:STAS domain-containing protein [Streptomyces sp. NPDC006529]|uniref:STAS domain-containing protein n=1 Tax=Streptomyces sp. NPDC006529 TaxID=3157177 RepID=UPI0033BFA22B